MTKQEGLIKELDDLGNILYNKFGTDSYLERCTIHDLKAKIKAINFTDSCEKLTFKIGENCKIKELKPVVITERLTEFLYKAQRMDGETITVDNTDLIKISS